jgi:type I restriction enzyme S subunit
MNEILENKIEELQLDKSKWKLTKFGDAAIQQKGRVDRENTELTRYIQGGHMTSEDLHIRDWGNLTDEYLGPAFIRKFEKGDILYGSRRTYLRKVAIADFDGITSNTTFVIKANEDKIDKRLLPFIMMSEGFTENSIKNSKGSVNPYINWKDIAKYEFLLPPKDQQAKLAELLWALDEVIESQLKSFRLIDDLLKVKREALIIDNGFSMIRLDELCEKKISYGIVQAGPHIEQGMPYIKSSNLSEDGIKINELQKTSSKIAEKYKRSEVLPGDIVFSLRGNLGEMNIIPDYLKVANLTQGTARLNVKTKYNSNYVKCSLETMKIQRRIHALSKGSTFKEISLEALRTVKIPMPSFEKSNEIFEIIQKLENNRKNLKIIISSSKALQKSLINQVF